jgi:hypothetical protein
LVWRASTAIRCDAHSPSVAAHADAGEPQLALELARRVVGRVLLEPRMAADRETVVERQRAQRADPLRDTVVGVRAAAQAVEVRLVADHAARHAREAAGDEDPRELARLGAAELGVAAAVQVQVALDHAGVIRRAVAQDRGRELALLAVAQ